MFLFRLILLILAVLNLDLLAGEMATCIRSSDCQDGEVCVSYTSCDAQKNKQQVRQCLSRECYNRGYNCPNSVYCQNKHCGDIRCSKK